VSRSGAARSAIFPLTAIGWSLGLFALLRSPWVEGRLVLPFTRWQQGAAEFYAGPPTAGISVTAACSGTDVLALCLAAILSWPASWGSRLAGAAGGAALILTLNTLRLGSLGRAAASPDLFNTLHLQVWPAILVLATAGYVFLWMRSATRADTKPEPQGDEAHAPSMSRRFGILAALFLVAFAFCGPWIARSESLQAGGAWVAGEAALVLTTLTIPAQASGNVLTTSRGSFTVTPECLATALIPLYLAFVFAAPLTWPRRLMALCAALPLFATLSITRVLLLALPPFLVASPLFLVHGFHQLVLGVFVVASIAWWREPSGRDRRRRAAMQGSLAVATAALFAAFAGSSLTSALLAVLGALTRHSPRTMLELAGPGDAQGALVTLFAFQASFLLAMGLAAGSGGPRILAAFSALAATQIAFLWFLVNLTDAGGAPHALLLRAWAAGLPMLIASAMFSIQPRAEPLLPKVALHGSA
jgi:exosortase/archaeosortase family protein